MRRSFDEYFERRRETFDLDIDLGPTVGFSRQVLEQLALVPYGEATTYGELARRVEHPRAARAVGTVMNRNPIPIVLPCHRVVGANGQPHRLRRRARAQGVRCSGLEGAML